MANNINSMVDSAVTQDSIYANSSIWDKGWLWCVDNVMNDSPPAEDLNRCSTPIGLPVIFTTGKKVSFREVPEVHEYQISCEELLGKRFWNRFNSPWRRFQINEQRLNPVSASLSYEELRIKFNNFRRSLPCEIACADYDPNLDFNESQQLLLSNRFTNLYKRFQ